MVPIYKGEWEILDGNNCGGIQLMSHAMSMWERMVEAGLRRDDKSCS